MAAPLFAPKPRRPSPLALEAGSLPPFSMAMASPINEKDMLPCIMITPSTPSHEKDFEMLYFATPEKPSHEGFLSTVRNLFSQPTYRIRLPDTPDAYPYGRQDTRERPWSMAKRLRTFLLLFTMVFVVLHLFVLPRGEGGVFDMLHPSEHNIHDPAVVWEGWAEPPNAASGMAASLLDDEHLPTNTVPEVRVTITTTATVPLATEL